MGNNSGKLQHGTSYESIEEAVLIIDFFGGIKYKSKGFVSMFKTGPKCRFFADILENIHPDDKNILLQIVDKSNHRDEEILLPTVRVLENSHNIKYVRPNVYVFKDKLPVNAILIIFREIDCNFTHKLDFKQDHHHNYFNMISDGIIVLDKALHIYEINDAFTSKLGYSSEEIRSRQFSDLLDPLSLELVFDIVKKLENENSIHFELDHFHKEGNVLSFDVTCNSIDLCDKQLVLLLYRDISGRNRIEEALRESEKKYKNIINDLTDIYYRTDAVGNIVMVSPSCLETFGYSSIDQIIGQPLENVYLTKEERNSFIEMLKKNGKVKNYRTSLLKKDGTVVYVETTSNLLFDNQGKYAGVEGIVRDISDRVRAEQALKESEMSLREINASKDKLFSIIAHDLKSPFTSIIGFSELLSENLESLTTQEIKEFVKHIDNSAKNTLYLVENLLIWAKTQTGQIVYNPEHLDFRAILQQVFDLLDASAKIKNISLNFLDNKDVYVLADQNMLQAILRNLISNAIKFTETGGEINVSVKILENLVEIAVSDTGTGMDKAVVGTLFQVDKQMATRGTAQENGSGLGLIICKEFVERHGGKIWVETEPGKGSTFYFTLFSD